MVDNSERIDKFLKKQLSQEENKRFLDDIRDDDNLRKEAQITALMIQELQERQAKEDAPIIEDVLASKKKTKIVRLRWSLSIAAMFILIFGTTLLWNRQSDTDKLFNEYYSSYTIDHGPIKGGDNSNVEEELAVLFNQIGTEKNVSTVIDKLQKIYDSIDSEYEYSLYTDDIAWYLALAYLKDEKPEKAKELLKPLAANGHEKAIALIADIN